MENTLPAILLIILMLSLSVVGCLSGSSPEASDGTEIELGEPLDDWPTYHVASASNLPTCPGANDENLGKLYYVEDVTEFQACTSSGWSKVSRSNLYSIWRRFWLCLSYDFLNGADSESGRRRGPGHRWAMISVQFLCRIC